MSDEASWVETVTAADELAGMSPAEITEAMDEEFCSGCGVYASCECPGMARVLRALANDEDPWPGEEDDALEARFERENADRVWRESLDEEALMALAHAIVGELGADLPALHFWWEMCNRASALTRLTSEGGN